MERNSETITTAYKKRFGVSRVYARRNFFLKFIFFLNKPSRQTMGGYGNATAVCKLKNRQNTY